MFLLELIVLRYTPSQADVHVFNAITSVPTQQHVKRWYTHIKSYTTEFGSLPGSSTAGEAFTSGAGGGAAPAAEEGDDDIDLFGEDEEEDAEAERIKAERVAEYNKKKAGKPKTIAKVALFVSSYQYLSHRYSDSLWLLLM